jgi:hypothetical protein
LEDHTRYATHVVPMGNYVIAGVGNYVIVNPSNLGNYVIADKSAALAGILLGVFGGGALIGSLLAARLALQQPAKKLTLIRKTAQPLVFGALIVTLSPLVLGAALLGLAALIGASEFSVGRAWR